ncbi:MAG: hypothetical protein ACRDRI_26370 [Pseudonocardiaceae bacterium]
MPPNLVPATGEHRRASYSAAVLWAGWDAVSRWWDGVELWLTQLGLALQVALLMLVLLPVCWWAARALDWAVGLIFERSGHRYAVDAEEPGEPR